MFDIFKAKVTVQLHGSITAQIRENANQALPNETGGLLLGWWDGSEVIVEGVVEVPDDQATSHSWTRRERWAQEALDHLIYDEQNKFVGYVGDWHSHPAECGASNADLASLRRASLRYNLPIVLVVHPPSSKLYLYAARKGRLCGVRLVKHI